MTWPMALLYWEGKLEGTSGSLVACQAQIREELELGVLVDCATHAARGRAFAPGGRGSRFPVGLAVLSSAALPGRLKELSCSFIPHPTRGEKSGELFEFWRKRDTLDFDVDSTVLDLDLPGNSLVVKKELVVCSSLDSGVYGESLLVEGKTRSDPLISAGHGQRDSFVDLQIQDRGTLDHAFSRVKSRSLSFSGPDVCLNVEEFPPLARRVETFLSLTPIRPSDFAAGARYSGGLTACSVVAQAQPMVTASVMVVSTVCPLSPVCLTPDGHVTLGCPELLKSKELQIFVFGVPGQAFYALEVEEMAKKTKGVGAIIKVTHGEHSLAIIEKEMRYWVDDKWQWNVNKISDDEYFTNFPNATALRICMRGGETTSPLCKIQLKVRESDLAPDASSMLQTTRVKVFDVPSHARNAPDLKEISKTFGRPRDVDMKTLPGFGPIRVQVDCRDATKLSCRIEVFLNKVGFKFKIEADGVVWDFSEKPKLDTHGPGDGHDDGDGGATDDSADEAWDRHRKQNKGKPEPSGSKHVGSNSSRQHLIGHYVSCFTRSFSQVGVSFADHGRDGLSSDKGVSDPAGDSSTDEESSPTHVATENSASSATSVSPSRSSVSPLDQLVVQGVGQKGKEMELVSWNSAGAKALVLAFDVHEEINGDVPMKCTPEDEVFDSEFGRGDLAATEEEDDDKTSGENQWFVAKRKNGKRSKTVPVCVERKKFQGGRIGHIDDQEGR
ncbi:hypothetical protein ACQ4PT_014748 [Festuca glaucescens]